MSLFSVASKKFLITGGSRGIGLHIARGIKKLGGSVIISSRTEEDCRSACAQLNERSTSTNSAVTHEEVAARYVVGDCSSRSGCEALADEVSNLTGGCLDVLVNNAGCAWGEDLNRESGRMNWGWDKVLDLNVKAPFYLSRSCLPMLTKDKDSISRIINIGSVAGIVPQEAPTHAYDTSKAAIHHLTKKLSADFAPRGITVNCVAPGFVPTRMSKGLGNYASMEKLANMSPLGRLGEEEDMVGPVVFFSSRAGEWCTGVIMNVDGGVVGGMRIPLESLDQ